MYKKFIYPLVLLLVLFSTTVVLAEAPEELIINGDFEAGTAEGAPSAPWVVEVTDTNTVTIVGSQSPFGPSDHQQSAKIVRNSATGDAILKQLVSFAGSDYLLMSCDVMLETGTETFSIRLGDILGETNGISLTLSAAGGLKALEGVTGNEREIFAASNVSINTWYRLQAIIPEISDGTYRVTLEDQDGTQRLISGPIGVTRAIPSPESTGTATVDNVSLVILDSAKVPVIELQTPSPDASSKEALTSVTATFDEDVVAKNLGGITITDVGGNSPSGVTAGLGTDNKTVTITWSGDLADSTYTVTIPAGAIENLIGNGNAETVWSFTVDTTAPTIESVTIDPEVVLIGEDVTIRVDAHDATGVSGGWASIYSPEDQKIADIILTGTAGSLSCVWGVPNSSTLGTWKVGSITLIDTLGNQGEYTYNYIFQVVDELEPSSPFSVILLSPIGGERWSGFNKIQWDAIGDPLTVDLFYSCDGGSTWTQIASGLENTGEYIWDTGLVPQGGNQFIVKVQITDSEGNTEYDESGFFTIAFLGGRRVLAGPTVARTSTTFYYDFEEDGDLYIYNSMGRLVYKTRIYAFNRFYEWDLTDLNGVMLGNGTYIYRLITDGGEMSDARTLRIERGSGLSN